MSNSAARERERFEAWATKVELHLERKRDNYASYETSLIWEGWAARAESTQPAEGEEREDEERLRERMSDLLTRTANALRGEPPALTRWSWHDLPERAAAAIAAIDVMQHVAANLAGESAEGEQGAEPLREALRELVACKDLKDRGIDTYVSVIECKLANADWHQRQKEYRRRAPLAWEAARAALSAVSAPLTEPTRGGECVAWRWSAMHSEAPEDRRWRLGLPPPQAHESRVEIAVALGVSAPLTPSDTSVHPAAPSATVEQTKPFMRWPFPINVGRSWSGFNVCGDEASIAEVDRLAHCEARLKYFQAEVLELRAALHAKSEGQPASDGREASRRDEKEDRGEPAVLPSSPIKGDPAEKSAGPSSGGSTSGLA